MADEIQAEPIYDEETIKQQLAEDSGIFQVAVDIACEMGKKLEQRLQKDGAAQPIICKIPGEIRDKHESAYEPKMVAIGPYHRSDDNGGKKMALESMEVVKQQYLKDLCSRDGKNTLARYVDAIQKQEQKALQQYSQSFQMSRKDFVEMLVLDGCFIVEFLLKRAEGRVKTDEMPLTFQLRISPMLRRDLFLFENQIPFFILETILGHTTYNIPRGEVTILDLVIHYLCKSKSTSIGEMLPEYREGEKRKQVNHLLHLSHLCLVSQLKCPSKDSSPRPRNRRSGRFLDMLQCCLLYAVLGVFGVLVIWKWPCWDLFKTGGVHTEERERRKERMIPTATKLKEAGVHFRKKESNRGYLDVSFKDGIMEIPTVSIQENTISEYRNFLALEQTCKDYGNSFTSFVVFMDNLIDTADDVGLLKNSKIIESKLGCEEDVASFFNQIRSGLVFNFENHYLSRMFEDVNSYCNKTNNRWRAKLMHDYLSSPWAIISVLAAFVLLVLTTTQTVYSAI